MRNWLAVLAWGLGGFALFLSGIGNPREAIFDEIQYLNSSRALLAGTPNPNPEAPPLGKLIVAGSIAVVGDNPWGWRMTSALFGGLTLAAVFLLVNLLLEDYALALTAAAITLLNNFLYVFSRTAMMDIFLVAFALWGVLAFTAALTVENLGARTRRMLLAFSGVMLGLSCACKWNGVDELCVVMAIGGGLLLWSKRAKNPEMVRLGGHLREAGAGWFTVSFLLLPGLTYLATFWPLCRSLRLPFSGGELVSMNVFIWHFHRAVIGNRGLIRPWYTWPLETQPTRALSYLVGNWYVMWAGLVALFFCLRRFARSLPETLVVSLYAANLLQWAVTPQRCLFYYYYFPSAMFLGMAIPVALHRLPPRYYGVRLSVISVLPAFCVFVYCFAHMAHLGVPYDSMLGYWP